MWSYRTPGIPDEIFERNERVPITKEEVRVVSLSKARLREGGTVLDIGCGSGSITVEAAMQVGSAGKVYAIDQDEEAVNLTEVNAKKFGVSNIEIIHSKAQDAMARLPPADAIFIGGTGGDTYEIIKLGSQKLKKKGRIVIDTILIETMYHSLKAVEELALEDIDVTQVTVAKSRKVSTGSMMLARNPVLIISAQKP
ncbi:MAG: precorrin-6Y C5,15-methyltransferase (decarboxylating) subunit CbiT [Nitrososphaerales archaeon]